MSVTSKYYNVLAFIFSKDLSQVLLQKVQEKIDGFYYQSKEIELSNVDISKQIFKETNIEIKPANWRLLISLQNIEKIWRTDILMTIADIEKIQNNEKNIIISMNKLPNNCHPNLYWLLPLAIDPSIHPSIYNQILMK